MNNSSFKEAEQSPSNEDKRDKKGRDQKYRMLDYMKAKGEFRSLEIKCI